jgi:multimeric flavodoxin WrbA
MATIRVRKGQAPPPIDRAEFSRRFLAQFRDPAFAPEKEALARLEAIAFGAFQEGRKSPTTRRAGPGFADPDQELSTVWLEARERIARAAADRTAAARRRVLVVAGASRNDGTCPGEISKTFRLARTAVETLEGEHALDTDLLDLSLVASDYGRRIFPCKACVSTSMPLCNWPCSCYPNAALGQEDDWMNEIYERWTRADGVLLVTPVYWYQVASPVKLMMDRLVCADGGNPDPTRTGGKDPERAKRLELEGWDYPKHLAGRAYGVVVHGDVSGVEDVRRALCDWLTWMGLVQAGGHGALDRYIGYYEPYATSHDALDADGALHEEVRNVARAVARTVGALRDGSYVQVDRALRDPRPK